MPWAWSWQDMSGNAMAGPETMTCWSHGMTQHRVTRPTARHRRLPLDDPNRFRVEVLFRCDGRAGNGTW